MHLEDELFRRAYFDDLTGLPNRGLLEKAVEDLIEAVSEQTKFALAFIDIDNFKYINDYYGHAAGDGLLVKIARRIAGQIRSTDMLARVGGDEFVLLLSPIGDLDELNADIRQLSDTTERAVSSSTGMKCSHPHRSASVCFLCTESTIRRCAPKRTPRCIG